MSEGGRGRRAARRLLVVEDADGRHHVVGVAAAPGPPLLRGADHPPGHLLGAHPFPQARPQDGGGVLGGDDVPDPVRPQHEAEDGRGLDGQDLRAGVNDELGVLWGRGGKGAIIFFAEKNVMLIVID